VHSDFDKELEKKFEKNNKSQSKKDVSDLQPIEMELEKKFQTYNCPDSKNLKRKSKNKILNLMPPQLFLT
jgi:hypothetical protein